MPNTSTVDGTSMPSGTDAFNPNVQLKTYQDYAARYHNFRIYDDITARDADTLATEGWSCYVKSTDIFYRHNGTAWFRPDARTIAARQAFSVVNAVTVDTIFETTLSDIYRVTLDVSASDAATGLSLVFRNGTTDYVTADQTSRAFELNSTATPNYSASATAAQIAVGRANGAGGGVTEFTIFSPNAAQYTRVQGQVHDGALSRMFWGHVPNSTAFTGFKIKADASRTITGVVTVEAVLKGS